MLAHPGPDWTHDRTHIRRQRRFFELGVERARDERGQCATSNGVGTLRHGLGDRLEVLPRLDSGQGHQGSLPRIGEGHGVSTLGNEEQDLANRQLGSLDRAIPPLLGERVVYIGIAHPQRHEVAAGQHEINFTYDDALRNCDRLTTYRQICAEVAKQQHP